MKKRAWKRTLGTAGKLLLSVFALLLVLTGCDFSKLPKTDPSINAKIIYTFYGYTSVKFDSFADFDRFREKLQQEHSVPFYFLDEDRFEGTVTGYEYQALDRTTALVAPYEPQEYIIDFEFEENGKICRGKLSLNLRSSSSSIEMTDELFETRRLSEGGRSHRHWHYSLLVGENTAIASITITATDGFDWDSLGERVVDALVWAYRDQGFQKTNGD